MEIKEINVLSAAKMGAIIYGLFAIIWGLFSVLAMTMQKMPLGTIGVVLLWIILAPVLGFLGIAFMSWVYNQVAKRFGGVIVKLEKHETQG